MKENNFKGLYASAYDQFYSEKNYEAECDFIEEIFRKYSKKNIKNILDLGCGTGGHALPLAIRGYNVYGCDKSNDMITIAKEKAASLNIKNVKFEVESIQKLNLNQKFDAVICMFAVIGYQTTNERLLSAFKSIRRHLKKDGLFICDFWYGPAVLTQKPECRVKIINKKNEKIIRIAEPVVEYEKNVVKVCYHVLHFKDGRLLNEIKETHEMRYFFVPEFELFLKAFALNPLKFVPFLDLYSNISEKTWNITSISKFS